MCFDKPHDFGGSLPDIAEGRAWLTLFRGVQTAREIDRVELEYVKRGLAFFHVSGARRESSAALVPHLEAEVGFIAITAIKRCWSCEECRSASSS